MLEICHFIQWFLPSSSISASAYLQHFMQSGHLQAVYYIRNMYALLVNLLSNGEEELKPIPSHH